MLLRPARRKDALAIARIHAASWRWAYASLLPKEYLRDLSARRLAPKWQQTISAAPRRSDSIWVAQASSRSSALLGFAHTGISRDARDFNGLAGEVFMLYVDPESTGQGLGSALLRRAADDLEQRGAYWLHIWALEDNLPAQRFYRRHGFRPDGARRFDRFTDTETPVTRFSKPLNRVLDQLDEP